MRRDCQVRGTSGICVLLDSWNVQQLYLCKVPMSHQKYVGCLDVNCDSLILSEEKELFFPLCQDVRGRGLSDSQLVVFFL